jgi:exonuclease SbcD
MKIVHFSDVHIGVENFSRTDPETGLPSRLLDFLATLDEVVDYCIAGEVDLALFCGDAYKSRDPSQTHQREFARRIARLSGAGVATFLVEGNHDIPAVAGRATALDIFRTLDVAGVTVGNQLSNYLVETRSGPVQILAVPWVRRSGFLARDETRGLAPEQVNELIQMRLTDIVADRVASLDPAIPAVLAGHLTVSEAKTSSEQSMMLGRDYVLLKSSLAVPQLDYVALGHIHRHQVLGERPHLVYSGALQRVDFGEEKDEKGFCVIELDAASKQGERMTSFEFVGVNARRLLTISVDVKDGDLDPTGTVVSAIASHEVADAVVRVQISIASGDEAGLADAPMRSALEGAHFVASISREVRQENRTRLGGEYDSSTGPREALELYLKTAEVPEKRAAVLLEYAATLIDETEPERP